MEGIRDGARAADVRVILRRRSRWLLRTPSGQGRGNRDRLLRFVARIHRSRFRRRVANQRNRKGVAHGAEDITRVGAYVQSRSSAGARKLSVPWDDRLQGRGRALAAALSSLGSCQLPLQSASEGMFRRPGCLDSRQNRKNFNFFEMSDFKILRKG